MDILDAIADQRRACADFVDSLSDDQLSTQSLCEAWTVKDCAAHLLMPLVTSKAAVAKAVLMNGLSFDRANCTLTAAVADQPAADIAAGLRANARHPFRPPGFPLDAPLTDLLIHEQDMRRPLGITAETAPERLTTVLDFLVSGKARGIAQRRRVKGFRYEATDLEWSGGTGGSGGMGGTVRGPAASLMLVLAGRDVALADVTGDGADALRSSNGG